MAEHAHNGLTLVNHVAEYLVYPAAKQHIVRPTISETTVLSCDNIAFIVFHTIIETNLSIAILIYDDTLALIIVFFKKNETFSCFGGHPEFIFSH